MDSRKSVSVFIMFLIHKFIMWTFMTQKTESLSSAEKMYRSIFEAGKEKLFFVLILISIISMIVTAKTPVSVRLDGLGGIFMTTTLTRSKRTWCIDITYV